MKLELIQINSNNNDNTKNKTEKRILFELQEYNEMKHARYKVQKRIKEILHVVHDASSFHAISNYA